MSDSSGHIHSDIRRHGIRVARLVQGDGLTKLPNRILLLDRLQV
jgi:PleD family two-component response regulator